MAKSKAKNKASPKKREQSITELMRSEAARINKEMGYPAAGIGDDYLAKVTQRIPFGCASLDQALGGGLPVGRTVEMFGMESTGKSTIADAALASVQRIGGAAIKIDSESSHDDERFERMGGKPNDLLLLQPRTIEDALTTLIGTCNKIAAARQSGALGKDKPILIVWDTLHAVTTGKLVEEKDGEVIMNPNASGMAGKARYIQDFFRFASLWIPYHQVCLFLLNQMISNISPYGAPMTTSGGLATRFYASWRMQTKRKDELLEGTVSVGIEAELNLIKNKVDGLQAVVRIPIRKDIGLDSVLTDIWYLFDNGFFQKQKGWYKFIYAGQVISFQEKAAKEVLAEKIPNLPEVLAAMVTDNMQWDMVTEGVDAGLWAFPEIGTLETQAGG